LPTQTVYYDHFAAMGTRLDVVLPTSEPAISSLVFELVKHEIVRLDARLNRYSPTSDVTRIVKTAANEPVILDDELWDLFMQCAHFHKLTHKYFDITVHPLSRLWQIKHGIKRGRNIPTDEQINQIKAYTGFDKLHFDETSRSIRFIVPGVELDFGGIAKGFALEKIKPILRQHNIKNVFISFGESSILAVGSHPHGDCWKLGIKNLFDPTNNIYTFDINDSSLSTSGINLPDDDDTSKVYSHIINPVTGMAVEGIKTVSAQADSPTVAEVLSTAIFIAPDETKTTIMGNFSDCKVVEIKYATRHGVEILEWI